MDEIQSPFGEGPRVREKPMNLKRMKANFSINGYKAYSIACDIENSCNAVGCCAVYLAKNYQ